ncbi:sensor histidine kinase [Nocardioides marmotae]|uniref:histidine kinase n=1 Tax=Nocardioides marmotae TaxID=2663857 RepID=A0A6I3JEH1_9ACTN|nr:PAS domain-containing sensor histidine kinase [Nocardioides marmotae]MCR6032955.1 PAS domain S-box protein [Gordonia jinghuaiqii]MBC9733485.1 PAS domain S-box protein [Nocardioides marmotae]MTB84592.1 PAS domain S-box protein [Nocardioides marmotae]MTB96606.1 PAS domain S-box protein [Nocardioides marmotae]QKE01879.1 PAS domain S-box protein [Nocardioides marmotae]
MDVRSDDGPATDAAALWRLTLEHSPIGMALVDLEGRVMLVNPAFAEMLGRDPQAMRGLHFSEITYSDDVADDVDQFTRAVSGETGSYRVRKRYLRSDGAVVWADLSVGVVRDGSGQPQHLIAQVLDITEQHEAEQRLAAAVAETERERQTLAAVFETVGVGLLLIDAEGRYQRMNRRHRETMSLPFPEGHAGAAGQLGHVYHLDGHTPLSREEMPSYRAAQGEEFTDYRYWVGDDPLTRAAFTTSARQVRSPSGERLGAALAYQEITDLLRALRVKDQFVSSVSHELRTPLTAVLGHLEMLCEDEELPGDVRQRLQVVRRNADRLRSLVSDVLLVARAGEVGLEMERSDVDLVRLVREAVEAARPGAERTGLDLTARTPGRLVVRVDERRVRQVVDNLLSNAVKYTEAGGSVRVTLRLAAGAVELEVADTGIGIAADELGAVFTRFFRGAAATARHIPGTGLGLEITSSIVGAHGGSVAVSSEPGGGSVFTVTLPA